MFSWEWSLRWTRQRSVSGDDSTHLSISCYSYSFVSPPACFHSSFAYDRSVQCHIINPSVPPSLPTLGNMVYLLIFFFCGKVCILIRTHFRCTLIHQWRMCGLTSSDSCWSFQGPCSFQVCFTYNALWEEPFVERDFMCLLQVRLPPRHSQGFLQVEKGVCCSAFQTVCLLENESKKAERQGARLYPSDSAGFIELIIHLLGFSGPTGGW